MSVNVSYSFYKLINGEPSPGMSRRERSPKTLMIRVIFPDKTGICIKEALTAPMVTHVTLYEAPFPQSLTEVTQWDCLWTLLRGLTINHERSKQSPCLLNLLLLKIKYKMQYLNHQIKQYRQTGANFSIKTSQQQSDREKITKKWSITGQASFTRVGSTRRRVPGHSSMTT